MQLYGWAFLQWIFFAFVGVANGFARVGLTEPYLGEAAARQTHSVILCLVLFLLIVRFVQRARLTDQRPLAVLGGMWMGLTLVFEFVMGFATGIPLQAMLADFNIFDGRLWPLVLLTMAIGPRVAGKLFVVEEG